MSSCRDIFVWSGTLIQVIPIIGTYRTIVVMNRMRVTSELISLENPAEKEDEEEENNQKHVKQLHCKPSEYGISFDLLKSLHSASGFSYSSSIVTTLIVWVVISLDMRTRQRASLPIALRSISTSFAC